MRGRRSVRVTRIRPILLAAATLLAAAGLSARGETFDLYVYSYCPPSPAFCGAPEVTTAQQYRDYIEDAVEEINRQWEVNGISFRPQIQNIQDNAIAELAQCADDLSTPFDETLIFNAWRANVASTHPKAISVILQNWDSPGLCCSQLPINNDPDPEEIWGVRCKVSPRYDLGSVLAHELGHHFCLCHTHGWNNSTQTFMDTVNTNTGADGPLNWDGDGSSFCAVTDTDADPGSLEFALDNGGALLNPQPPGMDLDPTGAPVNGHEWCLPFIQSNPALIDDWSPHQSFCTMSCTQYANGQASPFFPGPEGTTVRDAMSYHDDRCRGPYVVGGVRKESFTPVQKSRIEFCRQTYRSAGSMNDLVDVCAGAGGDSDHDGICQDDDNCRFVKNTSQVNRDGDGSGDECDPMPDLPDALGAILQQDDDADGCPDLTDQHPSTAQIKVGSGFSAPCGYGVVPQYGFEGEDSDLDGLLNCEDLDDDNDGVCDEGGPLPGGSKGVPPGGCAAGPAGEDDCPTSGPGAFCHLEGAGVPCPPEWMVCLGGGCLEYFAKLVPVDDPASGVIFDSFQILGRDLYLGRLAERTLTETARVLQGDFAAAGLPAVQTGGMLRLEIWSRRDNRPVAVAAEYAADQAFLDATEHGLFLEVTPDQDLFGNTFLSVRGTFAPGLSSDFAPRDSDGDGWPDWIDNCVLHSNPAQTDADRDGFGTLCDADLDGDRTVTMTDVEAVRSCDGADLGVRFPVAEPASLQGMALNLPSPAVLALAERCRAADLDESGVVDVVDGRIAEGRLGEAPGPSSFEPSGSLCGSPSACDDGSPCTVDRCIPATGQCVHTAACDDGNACTTDACDPESGACIHSDSVCDDGNVCTVDSCRPSDGRCVFEPNPQPVPCEDGDACTSGDFCSGGACTGRSLACGDSDPCTRDTCDSATGMCVFLPGGCDDGNPCTANLCDSRTGCTHAVVPDGTECEDGNLCTTGDVCRAAACEPTASVSCDIPDPCYVGSCNPADGRCSLTPVVCDDGLLDTVDSCDSASGTCVFTPIVPAEVVPVRFLDLRTLAWPATSGAAHWNTYRGTIPRTSLGSRPAGSEYDHACFENADLGGDGTTRTAEPSAPPPGGAYYYLVTGENSAVEGTAGFSTSGGQRLPPNPCVTPP